MHFGTTSVNWKTAGILPLFKHTSGANPASYLSLPVNSQLKLAEMVKSLDWKLMIYSLLRCLIVVTCCVSKYFRFILKPERVQGPPGAQLEISSKEGWKTIPFLDENIPYLEGGREVGGSESLNQKNLPCVVFAFPGPPWSKAVIII